MTLQKTKDLYGENVNPKLWKSMKYIDVLNEKIKLASKRIDELNCIHYSKRDGYAIKACMDSISFCRDLIKETE